ncbi:hypothetical protein [Croceicoccus hydrothermalis]|uniref:hypothetical protein n=1 Tax=Croceicoccus hydrothermalis TaxID=2867964 RepID=UPI001EFABAE7|nr:hypothetical protein [Croceicoccus hydrothermalis]
MSDLHIERHEDGLVFEPGLSTFAQHGIPSAGTSANEQHEQELREWLQGDLQPVDRSPLYTAAFLLVAAIIFGLPYII